MELEGAAYLYALVAAVVWNPARARLAALKRNRRLRSDRLVVRLPLEKVPLGSYQASTALCEGEYGHTDRHAPRVVGQCRRADLSSKPGCLRCRDVMGPASRSRHLSPVSEALSATAARKWREFTASASKFRRWDDAGEAIDADDDTRYGTEATTVSDCLGE